MPSPALQRLLDESAHVRVLARILAAEHADEVEQQTWLYAVRHGGEGVERPRSWLARIVRNVATNLRRSAGRRDEHECHRMRRDATVPSSAEVLEREEQRRRLVLAVDRLPEPQRAVVLLRYFEGLAPDAIAHRLGVPVTTVWNHHRRAMRLLRERLDREHGGRAAWVGPLAVLLRRRQSSWTRALIMTAKTKLTIAAGAILILAGTLLWPDVAPPRLPAVPPPTEDAAVSTAVRADTDPAFAPNREIVAAPASPTTGGVHVRVRYERDGVLAIGCPLQLRRTNVGHRFHAHRTTDATGEVRFEDVGPAVYYLTTLHGHRGKAVTVTAGQEVRVDLEIPLGVDVAGVVVDPDGVPIAGALVEHAPFARTDYDPSVVAVADRDGRFAIRDLPASCLVGARAPGYRASRLVFVNADPGAAAEVRLELARGGGCVDGVVVDPNGRPVRDAVVAIGTGRITGITPGTNGGDPIPAVVSTDLDGRFAAVGIAAGTQPVRAAADDYAPWEGECEVTADATVALRITLGVATGLFGSVLDAAGAPIAGADVSIGDRRLLSRRQTTSAHDGTFALGGLAAGPHVLVVEHDSAGRAEIEIATNPHAPTECAVRLSRGFELRGRVVDEAGQPLADTYISCRTLELPLWSQFARTESSGEFALANCPTDRALSIDFSASGYAKLFRHDVRATNGPLEVTLQRLPPSTSRITGRVLDPDGNPVANVSCSAFRREPRGGHYENTQPDGAFELGPMPPGTWEVTVSTADFPGWRSEPLEVAADQTLALGDIRLRVGGRARFNVRGDLEDLYLHVKERATGNATSVSARDGGFDSVTLAPGSHDLFVAGGTIALQAVRFDVVAGRTTNVEVAARTGTAQLVECDARGLGENQAGLAFLVRRGGERIGRVWAPIRDGRARAELFLAPGDYELDVVTAAEPNRALASTRLTIGDVSRATIRLTAR
ncbi:MAG: sigma-70 family RNA polymerase sigma factor [Planctomycetes bacterium]|nr:sigma-70 family RNA polymerase sigma factor [Planctomycetota bacterium]